MTNLLLSLSLVSVAILAGGWFGYPWWMARRGMVERAGVRQEPSSWPFVSVILATRESTEKIVQRIRNIRALDYDAHLLEIIVALDHSVAFQRAALQEVVGRSVRIVNGDSPGKASALNAGVRVASHPYLLFVDTAQTFAADVLRRLVEPLALPGWGAATATLEPTSGDALMDRYWRRELAIRLGQARRHSVICVTGCAYLMHRRYWRDMPGDLICDDLWSTYSVVTRGARVGIVPEAKVSDPRRFTRDQEYARRLRTMTGLLQFIRYFPAVCSPRTNPMWIDFALHKLVRPATPILLLIIGLSAVALSWQLSPRFTMWTGGFVACAVLTAYRVGKSGDGAMKKPIATLWFAMRLLFMPLKALSLALQGRWDVWKPNER